MGRPRRDSEPSAYVLFFVLLVYTPRAPLGKHSAASWPGAPLYRHCNSPLNMAETKVLKQNPEGQGRENTGGDGFLIKIYTSDLCSLTK